VLLAPSHQRPKSAQCSGSVMIQWSWDDAREGSIRARTAECNPFHWSLPAGYRATAKALQAKVAKGQGRRPVRVRLGLTEITFARADLAAESLLELRTARRRKCEKLVEGSESASCGEEPVCAVCLGALHGSDGTWQLPCGHCFHGKCMHRWFLKKGSCPLCRKELAGETIRHRAGCSGCGSSISTAMVSEVLSNIY